MQKVINSIIITLCIVLGILWWLRYQESGQDDTTPVSNAGLSLVFLDIGQGDATFITFPDGSQMLIDCALDARSIEALGRHMDFYDKRIDYLVVTHPDADHYGGCIDVIRRFDIGEIWYTDYEKQSSFFTAFQTVVRDAQARGTLYKRLYRREQMEIAGVSLDLLYPDHDVKADPLIPGVSTEDSNNTSVVMKVSYFDTDILLTADAEIELERYLIEEYGEELDVEIYKVGHHGSDTSSHVAFLEALSPEQAIISAGRNNKFNHPSRRVLKRLERSGATVWRTDTQNDILLNITNTGIHVEAIPTF